MNPTVIRFRPLGGRGDTFEVQHNGEPIGIVWDGDGCWHAARQSKAYPLIAKPDRMAAAKALIRASRAVL
jgi:hypothetical protein